MKWRLLGITRIKQTMVVSMDKMVSKDKMPMIWVKLKLFKVHL